MIGVCTVCHGGITSVEEWVAHQEACRRDTRPLCPFHRSRECRCLYFSNSYDVRYYRRKHGRDAFTRSDPQ